MKIERKTNIELLRLLSMFMIFLNHMVNHGILQDKVSANSSFEYFAYCVGTSIWAPAAVVFVLISGYFGIRPTRKGILKFSFLCTFYLVACAVVGGEQI